MRTRDRCLLLESDSKLTSMRSAEPLLLRNPKRERRGDARRTRRNDAPTAFHRRLPSYAPTRVVDAPELAAAFGASTLTVKDESHRLNMPSFKILGASW